MYDLSDAQIDELSLGQYLHYLRTQRGLTQYDLSDELNISQKWFSDIERGVYKHSRPERLRQIAEYFDVPAHVLFLKAGWADDPESGRRMEVHDAPRRAQTKQTADEMRAEAIALLAKVKPSYLPIVLDTLRVMSRAR
jgi:transcriptional regulator with XRE-family HTH domain